MSGKIAYVPALDGVRAAAIGLVLLQHYDVSGGWLDGAGLVGVDLFFVLSGYLITVILLDEWDRTGGINLAAFYRRRAFRIWPAFFAFLAICLAAAVVGGSDFVVQARATVAAALSYMNWSQAWHGPVGTVGHSWSLSIEEQFYLIWPAFLIFVLRRHGRVGVAPALAASLLVGVLWRLWLAKSGVSSWRLYYGTDTHADSLLIGCLLAAMPAIWPARAKLARLQTVGWIGLCPFALYAKWNSNWFVMEFFATAALGGLIVTAAASPGAWKALSSPPAVWLGKRSYSLYLWNVPMQKLLNFMHVGVWERALVGAPASILLAMASYRFIETPFVKWERDMAKRKKPLPETCEQRLGV